MIPPLEARVVPPTAVLLVLLVLPPLAASDDCPRQIPDASRAEATRLLDGARLQQAKGQWIESEAALRDAMNLDPASPFPPYALGLALMERKAFSDAVAAFTRSREAFRCIRGDDPEARRRFVAGLDRQLQQLRQTRAEYERDRLQKTIIKLQELNNDTPAPLGQSAQVVQALEQRIGELQRLRQNPQLEPAALALALGNAHFNAGDLAAAEGEFRMALAREPGNGDAHNNLAVTLTLLGRLDEAERELRAAEKAGIKVSPRIEEEIRRRRAATGC
jgi:tetratricopeptide (TPR) repeat protein